MSNTLCSSHVTSYYLEGWQKQLMFACNALRPFCFCSSGLLLQVKVWPPDWVFTCPNIAAWPWTPANRRQLLKRALQVVETASCSVLPRTDSGFLSRRLLQVPQIFFILPGWLTVYYVIISLVISLSDYNVCERWADLWSSCWSRALAASGGVVLLCCLGYQAWADTLGWFSLI